MRILVNDLAASASGALSVLESFYQYIRENDNENEYIFLLSGDYLEETERIKVRIIPEVKKSGFHKLYFDLLSGKKVLNQYNPDYVISLQNIITFGYKGKQAVFVHQAIPFQKRKRFSFFKKDERAYAFIQTVVGYFIKKSIEKADLVFVQTEWMKHAIIEICSVSESVVNVVQTKNNICAEYTYRESKNVFFYPAAFENIYKNQECIYAATESLCNEGIRDFKVLLTLNNHSPKKGCEFIGLLNKEELYKKYSETVLVFPSFIETVGLPLVEAMSVGSIIFSADCEYAHEVLNGYSNAYFFDPLNSKELADLMKLSIEGKINYNPIGNQSKIPVNHSGWTLLMDKVRTNIGEN